MKKTSAKSVYTSFVATPEVYAAIKKAAEQQDRSQSWIIGHAVEEYLIRSGFLPRPSRR